MDANNTINVVSSHEARIRELDNSEKRKEYIIDLVQSYGLETQLYRMRKAAMSNTMEFLSFVPLEMESSVIIECIKLGQTEDSSCYIDKRVDKDRSVECKKALKYINSLIYG